MCFYWSKYQLHLKASTNTTHHLAKSWTLWTGTLWRYESWRHKPLIGPRWKSFVTLKRMFQIWRLLVESITSDCTLLVSWKNVLPVAKTRYPADTAPLRVRRFCFFLLLSLGSWNVVGICGICQKSRFFSASILCGRALAPTAKLTFRCNKTVNFTMKVEKNTLDFSYF